LSEGLEPPLLLPGDDLVPAGLFAWAESVDANAIARNRVANSLVFIACEEEGLERIA